MFHLRYMYVQCFIGKIGLKITFQGNKIQRLLLVHACFSLSVYDFNVIFNNISVISQRSVLLVEETGLPGENHRPAASY